jgi:hypothetical protein
MKARILFTLWALVALAAAPRWQRVPRLEASRTAAGSRPRQAPPNRLGSSPRTAG